MVEYQLPKLATGVRFPSLAPCSENFMKKIFRSWSLRNPDFAMPKSGLKFVITILVIAMLAGCATALKREIPVVTKKVPGGIYHTVRRGETLWGIVRSYGVDLQSLIKTNSLYTGTIEDGQVLLIPRQVPQGIAPAQTAMRSVPGESFIWPVRGMLAVPFGAQKDKIINKGIDIRSAEGAGVRASRSGRVVYRDEFLKGYGKTVILDHGDGYQTVYACNSTIMVNVGDEVARNTYIAKVGRTGRANSPMLHFEIRKDGEPQNPSYYLPL